MRNASGHGLIAMSQIVLERSPTPDVLAKARQTIAMQGKEIEDLTKLLSKAPAAPASLEPFNPANRTVDRRAKGRRHLGGPSA